MGRILLEVCCGSADDVIEAHRGGADRKMFFREILSVVSELGGDSGDVL